MEHSRTALIGTEIENLLFDGSGLGARVSVLHNCQIFADQAKVIIGV